MLKVTKIELVFVCLLLLHWVSVAAGGLSLAGVSGGFSLWWLLLWQSTDSRARGLGSWHSRSLERRLSSCGLVALWHVGSSQTGNQTRIPLVAWWILSHWTTQEAAKLVILKRQLNTFHLLFLQCENSGSSSPSCL